MQNLIFFLDRNKSFLLFLFLETFSFWILFSSQSYQGTEFFNFSNDLTGKFYSFRTHVNNYFHLREINNDLLEENAGFIQKGLDNIGENKDGNPLKTPSVKPMQYKISSAYVVNNSIYKINNYLTINKGRLDSIKPGMGVVSKNSVIGIVRFVSDHFAIVTSMLNTKVMFSSKIKNKSSSGTITWNGSNPEIVQLKFIPKHVNVSINDTIITSSYSSIFPENFLIGRIESFLLEPGENFYSIQVKLNTDFSNLKYVYILNNTLKKEQEILEKKTEKN